MKRFGVVSALGVLLAGCGVFGATEPPPPEDDDPVDLPGAAPPAPVKGTPAESELTEAHGVFVVAGSGAGGDGTRARPFASIAIAVAAARTAGKRVFVCEGTLREALVVESGVSVTGGLDCSGDAWKVGSRRTRVESPSIPAVEAKGVEKGTLLEGLEIIAPDAASPSESSIGLFAVDAPALALYDVVIRAGKGAKGEDGVDGTQLVQTSGAHGKDGRPEQPYTCLPPEFNIPCPTPRYGEQGGLGTCAGAKGFDGEAGGSGGSGGIYAGDYAGAQWRWQPYNKDSRYAVTAGAVKSGANGADGADGASASSWGALTRDGFTPANGAGGTNGAPGKGGSGGSGYNPIEGPVQGMREGYQGAGGGAGGCPGLAGTPGKGGGASIAAFLVDSPIALDHVELASAEGGAGGAGTLGSHYSLGGRGGRSPLATKYGLTVSSGQDGGRGGAAGVSGSGAGGPSFAIAHTGAPPRVTESKLVPGKGGAGVAAQTALLGGMYSKTIAASADGASTEILAF